MNLSGKVALVTGAGRRVGRAIALGLAERGASIGVHCRNSKTEALEVVSLIEAGGSKALALQADLSKVAQIERMVSQTVERFGGLDVVVNSASVFERTPLADVSERDWDIHIDTNLKAPFFVAKFAGQQMRRRGAGKIVNIGDWAGIRPYKNYLPYTVSKSGLIGLTRALAKALAPEVQVNCIALGPVLAPEDYPPEEVARLARATLTGRLGSPRDVANAVLFLCEGTDFATGTTLLLDGGRLIA